VIRYKIAVVFSPTNQKTMVKAFNRLGKKKFQCGVPETAKLLIRWE
jgi:hypothetical protein